MKMTVAFSTLDGPGPVWRNGFWPIVNLIDTYFEMDFFSFPPEPATSLKFLRGGSSRIMTKLGWAQLKRQNIRSQISDINILFVTALNGSHVKFGFSLNSKRSNYTHSALYISENVEAEHAPLEAWQSYDIIFCFCSELAESLQKKTGVRTIYWPPNSDVLNLYSLRAHRPIDLLFMGRSNTNLLFSVQERIISAKADLTCVDFVTRVNDDRTQTAQKEFRLLVDMHSRSSAVACFEASYLPRYRGRSPLLSRWVYAWMAGCMVFGSRPRNKQAQKEMDWPGAMTDLPDDAENAIQLIEDCLANHSMVEEQRVRNVVETLMRHDTRHRLLQLCVELNLQPPVRLLEDIERVRILADRLRDGSRSASLL